MYGGKRLDRCTVHGSLEQRIARSAWITNVLVVRRGMNIIKDMCRVEGLGNRDGFSHVKPPILISLKSCQNRS